MCLSFLVNVSLDDFYEQTKHDSQLFNQSSFAEQKPYTSSNLLQVYHPCEDKIQTRMRAPIQLRHTTPITLPIEYSYEQTPLRSAGNP